jgi:hypothetical protein
LRGRDQECALLEGMPAAVREGSTRSTTTRKTASRGSWPSVTSATWATGWWSSPTNRPTGSGCSTSREPSSRHDQPAVAPGTLKPPAKNVGDRYAGEPHARFDAAAGGNQASRQACAAPAPPADPTAAAPALLLPWGESDTIAAHTVGCVASMFVTPRWKAECSSAPVTRRPESTPLGATSVIPRWCLRS